MLGSRDQLEIRQGSSSSSEDDELSDTSEASSSEENAEKKTGTEVGATVEFPQEKRRPEGKLKQKKKRLTKREAAAKTLARRELDRICMVKPDIVSDRGKERALLRIATKGVVHLFNAVAERHKELDAKLASKQKGIKRFASSELGSSAFKIKLAQKAAVKDEDEENGEVYLSDGDVKEERQIKEDPSDSEADNLMDTSEIKTEPESDGE